MSADFRALCADLLWALENAIRVIYHEDGTKHISTANPIVNRARAALADQQQKSPTKHELFILLLQSGGATRCVSIEWIEPFARAVLAHWGNHVPAPPADGEVAELAAWLRETGEGQPCLSDEGYARLTRAAELLQRQAPQPPADGEVVEVVEWLHTVVAAYKSCRDTDHIWSLSGNGVNARLTVTLLTRAAELLQRQALVPVSVSERLPGPEVCVPHPRTKRGNWCWGFERCEVSLARPARWRLMHMETVEMEASHWLPAHALPLPEVGE